MNFKHRRRFSGDNKQIKKFFLIQADLLILLTTPPSLSYLNSLPPQSSQISTLQYRFYMYSMEYFYSPFTSYTQFASYETETTNNTEGSHVLSVAHRLCLQARVCV